VTSGSVVHIFRRKAAHNISYTFHVLTHCLLFVVGVCNGIACFSVGSELAIPSYFPPQVIVVSRTATDSATLIHPQGGR
jgi:hypothetical protein